MKVGPSPGDNGASQHDSAVDVQNDHRPDNGVPPDGERLVTEEAGGIFGSIAKRYSQFLVAYPSVVLLLVCVVVIISAVLGFILNDFPSFGDPTLGFEARGTVISDRLSALRRMYYHNNGDEGIYSCPSISNHSSCSQTPDLLDRRVRDTHDWSNLTLESDGLGQCSFDLSSRFPIVYQSTDSMEMFTSSGMKTVCQRDEENFRRLLVFNETCYYRTYIGSCCPSVSLGHVAALMVGKESCQDIDDNDVLRMKMLLEECVGYYSRGCLVGDSNSTNCGDVPMNCTAYSGVYTIFYYLTPKNFALQLEENDVFDLQTVVVLQPLIKGYDAETLYEMYIKEPRLKNDAVQIVAVGGGFKLSLFAGFLFSDTIYIAIGCILVLVIIWVYVGSLFVTIMTFISIIMSMVVAYFLYHTIFRLAFFPFINVITAVLVIGVGADDCFVYVDIWKLTKKEFGGGRNNRVLVVGKTLKHAAATMFVTSFTTASALFAGCVSSITAVRCFSVFAGCSILVNFVFTVTWIPGAVMIHEKYFLCDEEAQGGSSCRCCRLWFIMGGIYDSVSRVGNMIFDEYLPIVVVKLRIVWIILLSGLGIGGFCVVFVAPRLSLPSQSEFQVFRTSHVLEQYDQVYKNIFSFESDSENKMRAFFLWGIVPTDNGNHWDPESFGTTVVDKNFDVKSTEAQMWLYSFCKDLRNASFYDNTANAYDEFCFIDLFKGFMENNCTGNFSPCCGQTTFPYSPSLFSQCVPIFYHILCQSVGACGRYIPGLWFNSDDDVVGMALLIKTNVKYSLSYDTMGDFWDDVNRFLEYEMADAPSGLRGGWFISEVGLQLSFFDLQQGLATGTPLSVGMSLVFSACVLMLTVRNVLVTLYAVYSIACAVFVVIASVVLLGWELNIFESTVLSLAVGLSVDFTVHLGVAYRQATAPDREARSMHALKTLGSAVTLAALTTFSAGGCMLPATVLSYVQLGTFLMIVMGVSWVYGLFLFMSLCRTIGPQGTFAQISRSCCKRKSNMDGNSQEMKPEEYAHEQHVDTSDERIQH